MNIASHAAPRDRRAYSGWFCRLQGFGGPEQLAAVVVRRQTLVGDEQLRSLDAGRLSIDSQPAPPSPTTPCFMDVGSTSRIGRRSGAKGWAIRRDEFRCRS